MAEDKKPAWGRVKRSLHEFLYALSLIRYVVANLVRRSSVLGDGPIVSLTSFGPRTKWAFVTIETIGRGELRPSRLILWLDDEAVASTPPRTLRRLQKRGLEIGLTEDFGPHKKYFPLVLQLQEQPTDFVTADDDVVYPVWWLAGLVREHRLHPEEVICYRGRRISLSGEGGFNSYDSWRLLTGSDGASYLNFSTGSGGVLYPASMVIELSSRGTEFLGLCPRADDVWLHQTAMRSGLRVRLAGARSESFGPVAISQLWSLKHTNVGGGQNDRQLVATYSGGDMEVLALEQDGAVEFDGGSSVKD